MRDQLAIRTFVVVDDCLSHTVSTYIQGRSQAKVRGLTIRVSLSPIVGGEVYCSVPVSDVEASPSKLYIREFAAARRLIQIKDSRS